MAITDNDISVPTSLIEACDLYSDPHTLYVFVIDNSYSLAGIHFSDLITEIQNSLRSRAAYIEAIWTPRFFRRWVLTPHRPDETPGLLGGTSDAVEIFNGELKVGITLPIGLFPAAPNPRGRPGVAEVEQQIADAIDAEVYFLLKFLKAFYSAMDLGAASAEQNARDILIPHIKPIGSLFYVNQSKNNEKPLDKEERLLANLEKIVCDMQERGSKAAAALWGADRRDSEAKRLSGLGGDTARGRQRAAPEHAADYRTRLAQLDLLVKYRPAARAVADAQRSIRREIGTAVPLEFEQAFFDIGTPRADGDRMAHPDRKTMPTPVDIVRLARYSAVLLTSIWGSLLYLRPLAEAARAIGKFERLGCRPDPSRGAADIIALYGLRAMADAFYGVDDPALSACLEYAPNEIVGGLAPADVRMLMLPPTPRLLTPGSTHDPRPPT